MNVSIYLNFWKYTEPLSVETSFFCCTMKEKRGSLQRLIKANLSLHKLPSLDWNKTQRVSERISKQMNEAVLFPADQAVWLSAVALETKGLPSHCHHSWKPAFSERKRLNAAPAPPAENECLTQSHYMQHKDEMATITPPKRVPSPPPSCHHHRGQGTSKVTYGFLWGNDGGKDCLKINVFSATVCCPAHGLCMATWLAEDWYPFKCTEAWICFGRDQPWFVRGDVQNFSCWSQTVHYIPAIF